MNAEPALTERAKLLTPTYGGYLAFTLKRHLEAIAANPGCHIFIPGATVQELGSSVYVISCTDCSGQEYRITVELAPPRTGEGEAG